METPFINATIPATASTSASAPAPIPAQSLFNAMPPRLRPTIPRTAHSLNAPLDDATEESRLPEQVINQQPSGAIPPRLRQTSPCPTQILTRPAGEVTEGIDPYELVRRRSPINAALARLAPTIKSSMRDPKDMCKTDHYCDVEMTIITAEKDRNTNSGEDPERGNTTTGPTGEERRIAESKSDGQVSSSSSRTTERTTKEKIQIKEYLALQSWLGPLGGLTAEELEVFYC